MQLNNSDLDLCGILHLLLVVLPGLGLLLDLVPPLFLLLLEEELLLLPELLPLLLLPPPQRLLLLVDRLCSAQGMGMVVTKTIIKVAYANCEDIFK